MPVGRDIGPLSSTDITLRIAKWPAKADLAEARATMDSALPAGGTFSRPVELDLESEELYTQTLRLEDF